MVTLTWFLFLDVVQLNFTPLKSDYNNTSVGMGGSWARKDKRESTIGIDRLDSIGVWIPDRIMKK